MTKKSPTIVLVGCGNMGRAMLEGWLQKGVVDPSVVHVVEPASQLREKAAQLGVHVYGAASSLQVDLTPDLIIFAVKPQVMFDVTPAYKPLVERGAAIVSVAAGIGTAKFEDQFGANASIIRVMPNTPAAVSEGMMVIYENEATTSAQSDIVKGLMSASGAIAVLADESLMDAATAVSGSGPAYVFHVIEVLRDAGIDAGLPPDVAKLLAEQTVYGAACYANQSDTEPGTLREQVTSPNGVTAEALKVLMKDNALKNLMREAVIAARERSKQLG